MPAFVADLPDGNPIIVTAGSQRLVVGAAVPEPSTLLLFLAGLALISGAAVLSRRKSLCG